MNEQIKQLAVQAGMVMYPTGLGIKENTIWGDRNIEKFAQLIVKECVGVVQGGSFLHDQAPAAVFARECSAAIKRHFETNTEAAPIKKDIRYCLTRLAEFPRVKDNIESMWGSERGRKYIFGLIVDDRDRDMGKVSGFPPTVIEAIKILLELHDEFYPAHKPPVSVWDQKL